MTMQGITAITAKTDQITPVKESKANDSAFGSLMSQQATRVSNRTSTSGMEAVTAQKTSANKKELVANRHSSDHSVKMDTGSTGQKVKDSTANTAPNAREELDVVKTAEMVAQTMTFLQEMYGLSPQELEDIMSQLSMQPQDLLFLVDEGMITLVNTTAIQDLLLGIHGIDDGAAFLTSDMLNQELTAVTEQITELLAEGFGVDREELTALAATLQLDFAEQLEKLGQGTSAEELAEGTITGEGAMLAAGEETMSVVVENYKGEAGTEDGGGQAMSNGQSKPQGSDVPASFTSAANAFTENLVQAFEEVHDTAGMNTESIMNQIVEQVVRQVRIRVMPETTSMELQLHPASLGRVSLTVATTAAGATASLVVENQMAKEALESQMIQLKESFAEQGLKVDAVEVTVAEFGLKKENQQQEEPAGGKKHSRRFRSDEELAEDEENVADHVTVSERRDVNSMVDYTA